MWFKIATWAPMFTYFGAVLLRAFRTTFPAREFVWVRHHGEVGVTRSIISVCHLHLTRGGTIRAGGVGKELANRRSHTGEREQAREWCEAGLLSQRSRFNFFEPPPSFQ